MPGEQFAHAAIESRQRIIGVVIPALRQFVIVGEINDNSGVAPERGLYIRPKFSDAGQGIRETVDVPMEHDAPLNAFPVFGQLLLATNKVAEHRPQPQSFVITGEEKMGKEIHRASLSEKPPGFWPVNAVSGMMTFPQDEAAGTMTEARTVEQPGEFPTGHCEFFLRGPAGAIECAADVPEAEDERPCTIIICHPHPLHSGNMHNKVVTITERSMRELGLRTMRFNFRGAGLSEGEHDDGYGETDDLFAVAEWVRRTRPDDTLWLGGFSFGSYVALRGALNLDIGQLISIAPPVDRYPFASLHHPECPWLVIQGDEDEVVNADLVRQWVLSLNPPPDLLVMKKADHFFHRRIMDLRGLLKNGVRDQLPAADGG